ncbi:uncharacterized protein F5891DRAFT_1189029 [Suillus fuscotomentosus]|uniref:Uncharacterized protein n=1 Tax=Suillus fuscotomentosus TaxID=1912939 RepID=A0AAD4E5H3_9AGAM|nr:uncharacterized protein F5891DRAFT_1189029 [Suillus fuscotomentosus]KAG1899945.1 hypothetical protein F5891DRAFT_1189029 [Suillus fuscotomentosus]
MAQIKWADFDIKIWNWQQAMEDGWIPGEKLFPIEEAINCGTIIMNLLSDAAQSQTWPTHL